MGQVLSNSAPSATADLLQPAMTGDLNSVKSAVLTYKQGLRPGLSREAVKQAVSAYVDTQDDAGNAALHGACFGGHTELVKYLYEEAGCSLTISNGIGCNAVFLAAGYGHVELLEYLLRVLATDASNADPNTVRKLTPDLRSQVVACNSTGDNALIAAASRGQTKAVELLLSSLVGDAEWSSVLNSRNTGGDTALSVAVAAGHAETAALLVRQPDIVIDNVNNTQLTPLLVACERGQAEILDILLCANADCTLVDANGASPLMIGVFCGHDNVVKVLLQRNQDTAIIPTADAGGEGVTESSKVVSRMTLVNKTDSQGVSPLWIAAKNGNLTMVQALVAAGADITHKAADGMSAVSIAEKQGKTEVVEYLLSRA